MKKFDWEAALIALVGITVFAILAVTPAWADQRYIEPTEQETTCVTYVLVSYVYIHADPGSAQGKAALELVSDLGMATALLQGMTAIDAGVSKVTAFAHMYKHCLAVKGDEVL